MKNYWMQNRRRRQVDTYVLYVLSQTYPDVWTEFGKIQAAVTNYLPSITPTEIRESLYRLIDRQEITYQIAVGFVSIELYLYTTPQG